MAEVTLKSFLDNDSRVKAARKKLTAASAELSKQKAALVSGAARITESQRDIVQRRIDAAQSAYNQAKNNLQEAETSRTQFFNLNQKNIQAKATTKDINKAKDELQELLITKQSQPNNPILDARIANLNDQINQRGKYAPKPKVQQTKDQIVGDQQQTSLTRDYLSEINGAPRVVRDMSAAERQNLAQVLKSAGFYKGPITGVYSDSVVAAYQAALAANQARSTAWGEEISWGQFLSDKTQEVTAGGIGTGGPTTTGSVSFSSPQEARAKVESVFQSEMGRLPTPEESSALVNDLLAREKKASAIQKATTKKVGGITITEYSGGFDRDQFLIEKIRKLPAYSDKKAQERQSIIQDLSRTASANGFDLTRNFGGSVEDWARRIQNGENIDIFKNIIRQTAKLGMPDRVGTLLDQGVDLETVYSPYKREMASILEVNEDSINLNDPTLRSAIGPDKEMTIYDFQRALRKDPRWQYTNNAREEVSNIALGVLRDFGFQG